MSKRGAQAAACCVLPPRISHYDSVGSRLWQSIAASIILAVVFSLPLQVSGQLEENTAQALLKFKTALANTDPALRNWNPAKPPCSGNTGNWNGVLCFNGYVWGLQLENMGLQGQIDVDALTGLSNLRTLSFMNNSFQGEMPDWRKLGGLKSLYLSGNEFSGQIPDDAFNGMTSLKRVYLSNNKFTGPIPSSLTSSKPIELDLSNNQFSGPIPAVDSKELKVFNVANNQLKGPVPPSLLKMDPSSFSGNEALCGGPNGPPCDPAKPPPDLEPVLHPPPNSPSSSPAAAAMPRKKKSSFASPAKIVIIILSVFLALFLILLLLLLCWWSRDGETEKQETKAEMGSPYHDRSSLPAGASPMSMPMTPFPQAIGGRGNYQQQQQQQQPTKLSFVRDDRQKFDLQDLMRASAEMLGHGNFGASYKAVLVDGEALVVKRFKQMSNIAKEDFHEHMRRLSRLKHPNLLPLVAYLYRKEEKLLVFDFVSKNSLAKHLHDDGKTPDPSIKPLNWPCRLKIIKGVIRGLAYLYVELPSLIVPHGHLKSSNVLIDSNYNTLLMDYGLGPIVNENQIDQVLVAYKCPEYARTGQISKKTDIWCLGILILETLTGRTVDKSLVQGNQLYNAGLAGWVNGIVAEAGAKGGQVFDNEMEINTERSRLEMEKLLHIGIACCREDLDKRLDLEEALRKIEQVQE